LTVHDQVYVLAEDIPAVEKSFSLEISELKNV